MLLPTWLHHVNGPVRPVPYHALTKYKREVTVSVVGFCSVSKSSGGPLPCHHPTTSSTSPPLSLSTQPFSISLFLCQLNKLFLLKRPVGSPPKSPVSMGSGDHLFSDGSLAHFPFDIAIQK
ncbi:hypothetical protein EVAR_54132_1 [Eumeta japonica]|uniref:Uncharacterized protein n=1 Tax=Eumeta variegata TaxID=151549 RepID=A0A4C1Z285_EUMVA|nr:hypothetical protein EVAR_54132_1 [Eumeta japonica]